MNRFTFAHLSDLHLPFEPRLSAAERLSKRQLSVWSWRRRGEVQSAAILEALERDLQDHPVDHVLVTGDVTNFSLPGEFEAAAQWLGALAPAEQVSVVPGNHDALVPVVDTAGLAHWNRWTRLDDGWPFVHRQAGVSLIGLNSAVPTAPLLAQGRLGSAQLRRLAAVLDEERAAGQVRIVALHHPVADDAVQWRKALVDRAPLRDVLARHGAELVLHGHARDARFDAVAGPGLPIPCLSVPSSSAEPNAHDEGARWHRLTWTEGVDAIAIEVRRWSSTERSFVADSRYRLCLPRVRIDEAREYAAA